MKDKPISFSTPMVKAIIDDRKTKTRRVIKGMGNKMHYGRLLGDWGLSDPPELRDGVLYWRLQTDVDDNQMFEEKCPWKVGQTLWVKETWRNISIKREDPVFTYKADYSSAYVGEPIKWKSSRYMPRKAARLFLKVISIRVERLQDITEEDARAEGIREFSLVASNGTTKLYGVTYEQPEKSYTAKQEFTYLWNDLNAKRGFGWDTNPWAYVIEFERVEVPE